MTEPLSGTQLDVLALNCGSSSLKFGVFRVLGADATTLISGEIDAIGAQACRLSATCATDGRRASETVAIASLDEAVTRIGRLLSDWGAPPLAAIGHRIVHGGPNLRQHCLISAGVLEGLTSAIAFAPLHSTAALEVIGSVQARYPGLPQVACFDTVFHAEMPEVARTLPIPRALRGKGVQRYGFHGLSCESIVQQLDGRLPERMIIAHLGAGASITAVMNGWSIDTSMGLTPTGGVMMATRSGDLDPGVLLYLLREKHLDVVQLEVLVDRQSGMLGVSGVSGDMRELEAAKTIADAALAIRMFGYGVGKAIGAMAAALEGADLIVFTGGVGENDAQLRATICTALRWMGVELDDLANRKAARLISLTDSACAVQVLPCQEDLQIARHTAALVLSGAKTLEDRPFASPLES